MGKDNRINWIDWAKSLCMFLVVVGHCHIRESEWPITVFIYSFHMPLFFFLSGLLCKHKSRLYFELLRNDVKRILLPYLTFGVITILFNAVLSAGFIWREELSDILLGTTSSIGAIWFLPALFVCKQLFYFLEELKKMNCLLFCSLVVVSFSMPFFISAFGVNLPFFSDSALFGLPFFVMGSITNHLINKHSVINNFFHHLLIISIAVPLTMLISNYNGFVSVAECVYGDSILLYYLNAFCGIISVISFCKLTEKVQSAFVTITSYGTIIVLGFHGYFLLLLQYYIPKALGFYNSSYPLYMALVYSCLVYFLCYLLIKVIDLYVPLPFGLKGNSCNYYRL